MLKINAAESLWKDTIINLSEHNQLEIEMCDDDIADQEAIEQIFLGALDTAAEKIGEALANGEEEVEYNISERLTLIGSIREVDGVRNMSLTIIPGSELKKRIKDDAGLTD